MRLQVLNRGVFRIFESQRGCWRGFKVTEMGGEVKGNSRARTSLQITRVNENFSDRKFT